MLTGDVCKFVLSLACKLFLTNIFTFKHKYFPQKKTNFREYHERAVGLLLSHQQKSQATSSQCKCSLRHLRSSSADMEITASKRVCAAAVCVRFDWSDKSHCIVSIPLAGGMCKHFKTECLCMRT